MRSPEFPFETPPSASLNRVQIMDLPGLPLDEAVRGRRGDELVSNRALMALAADHVVALGLLPEDLPPVTPLLTRSDVRVRDQVARIVDAALAGADPTRRAAAEVITRRLGRNLAWLLVTLHRGDAANRAVRPDWQAADWEKWAAVRRVWLGGGLTSGRLGEAIAAEARDGLAELGCGQIEVGLSPYRDLIALIGAARTLEARDRTVLGFDFGHTLVKRAVLTYRNAALQAIDPLPPRLADWQAIYPPEEDEAALGCTVLDFMAGAICETAAEVPQAEPFAVVSVAAYKQQGQLMGNGPYASIHASAADAPADRILAAAISERAGYPVGVRSLHDGTAAALAHAGTAHSTVIMLGTALGVGFPPATEDALCAIAFGSTSSDPSLL